MHRGELIVVGSVLTGVRFEHADGSEYGEIPAPRVADMRAKAFGTLRGLGFRETEVRRALADCSVRQDGEVNLERIVRDALAKLTANA